MYHELLFGADSGLEEWLACTFLRSDTEYTDSERRTLSQHNDRVFVASIELGRRNLSHCARNNWVVAKETSWPCHFTQWRDQKSCDLTPCDCFLWGFVKSRVYANKPTIISQPKEEIRRAIAGIKPQLYENVIENFIQETRAESWGTFGKYCVPHLITMCVLYTKIKIFFE